MSDRPYYHRGCFGMYVGGGGGFRWLIEREPYKYPRECEGCASPLDNDRDRPAMIDVANVYMLMIIQVRIKCLHDNFLICIKRFAQRHGDDHERIKKWES